MNQSDVSSRRRSRSRIAAGVVAALFVVNAFWVVGLHAHRGMLNGDTAQLISAGVNLLRGEGYSTDAAYYDEQVALGALPVPLTVWPPGYAIVVGALVASGVPPYSASVALGLLGHAVSIVVASLMAAHMVGGRWMPLTVAAMLAMTTGFTLVTLRGLTEPVFVAATLSSALLLLRAFEKGLALRWLVAAGSVAAYAFSVRYSGVAWIAACLCTVPLLAASRGVGAAGRAVAAFGVVPVAAVAWAFGRNRALTGRLTGGTAVGGDSDAYVIARQAWWSTLQMFGGLGHWGEWVVKSVIALLVLGAAIAAVQGSRRWRTGLGHGTPTAAGATVVLSATYAFATAAMLFHLSRTSYPSFIQPRYLLPLLPFAVLSAVALFALVRPRARSPSGLLPRVQSLLIAVVLALYGAGQWRYASLLLSNRLAKDDIALVEALEAPRPGGEPLISALQAVVTREQPLLAANPQMLTGLYGIPSVGLAGTAYTRTVWTEEAVRTLMVRTGSCRLLIDRSAGEVMGGPDSPLLAALEKEAIPEWLRRVDGHLQVVVFAPSWCAGGPGAGR